MKGVQCYELFGGIALKNHAFSFHFHICAIKYDNVNIIVININIDVILCIKRTI